MQVHSVCVQISQAKLLEMQDEWPVPESNRRPAANMYTTDQMQVQPPPRVFPVRPQTRWSKDFWRCSEKNSLRGI
jgi:hypothetical protein